jgi:hypothetical protein
VDVTGYLTVRMKELQGKDNLSAEIADCDKAFSGRVHLGLNRKTLSTLTQQFLRLAALSTLSCDISNLIKQYQI